MMQKQRYIAFTKMHSNGNDFMVVDRLSLSVRNDVLFDNIAAWSNRHTGIGFDGMIIVDPPQDKNHDFFYRIINADGMEVEQCGNGAVCFINYILKRQYVIKFPITVGVGKRLLTFSSIDHVISVVIGTPDWAADIIPCALPTPEDFSPVQIGDRVVKMACVSFGNPHAVTIVESVSSAPVQEIGSSLQSNALFPEKVNVGFMEIVRRNHIKLRVFERGVGETLCCGSGACAAVAVGIRHNLLDNRVAVSLPGGDLLVHQQEETGNFVLSASAHNVFSGKIFYDHKEVTNG